MVENFLRPPQGLLGVLADVLRALGVLGVVLAVMLFDLTDAGILAFALMGVFAPRFIGLRPAADVLTSVSLLIAAWSNVLDVYTAVPWWDVPMHILCTAVLAAGAHVFLVQRDVLPRPGLPSRTASVAMTLTIGLALSALWELVEWVGFVYITSDIYVTYHDTIGDIAAGGTGSLLGGCAVLFCRMEPLSAAGTG